MLLTCVVSPLSPNSRMKWHPASSARQFRSLDQALTPDQVAES